MAGVYNNVTLPQNIAEQVTVLRGEVITGARTLAQTLSEVRLRTSNEGVTGVQVAVGKEVAGETVFVKAPELAVILDPAQLLADAGRLLVAGQGYSHDHIGWVWLALGHREEGALGQDMGQQGEEAQERCHGHQPRDQYRRQDSLECSASLANQSQCYLSVQSPHTVLTCMMYLIKSCLLACKRKTR